LPCPSVIQKKRMRLQDLPRKGGVVLFEKRYTRKRGKGSKMGANTNR